MICEVESTITDLRTEIFVNNREKWKLFQFLFVRFLAISAAFQKGLEYQFNGTFVQKF